MNKIIMKRIKPLQNAIFFTGSRLINTSMQSSNKKVLAKKTEELGGIR